MEERTRPTAMPAIEVPTTDPTDGRASSTTSEPPTTAQRASPAIEGAAAAVAGAGSTAKAAVQSTASAVADAGSGATEAAKTAASTAVSAAADARSAAEQAAKQATVPPAVAVRRGSKDIVVAWLALLGFAAIFAVVRAGRTRAFDRSVTRAFQSLKSPAVDATMRAASWPGFPPQSRIIPPIIIAAQAGLGFRLEAAFQTLAWMTGLVSTLLKHVMKRPRPASPEVSVVTARLGGSSFPSGHVLTYVGTYGYLAYVLHTLIRQHAPRRALAGVLAALIALVGPSRIYQGHHWPTDVLASYLLGLSYLIGLTALYRWVKGGPTVNVREAVLPRPR